MKINSKLTKIYYYLLFMMTIFRRISGKNIVYIEMTKVASNRRLIQLVRYFSENSCFILVHIPVKKFIRIYLSELYVFKEKNIRFAWPGSAEKADFVLTDRPEKFCGVSKKKIVELDYDIFKRDKDYSQGYFFPISFYPPFLSRQFEQLALSKNTQSNRNLGVLFIGTIDHFYGESEPKDYFKINTRTEIFEYIQHNLDPEYLYMPDTYEEFKIALNAGKLKHKVVLMNAVFVAIPRQEYFDVLHETNYFIQMSGYIQPFCHNQIETMACGIVPITQFPYIFKPELQDRYNALVFNSLENLVEILIQICTENIKTRELSTMRKNIVSYYRQYYSYGAFIKKIHTNNTLYICAGKDSII